MRWEVPEVKKGELKKIADEVASEWEKRPFSELAALSYPVVFESEKPNGSDYYFVEIVLLELDSEHIHLGIGVGDSGWRSILPVTSGVIVKRPAPPGPDQAPDLPGQP